MIAPNDKLIEQFTSVFGVGVIGLGAGGGGASFDFSKAVSVSECAEIGHCGVKYGLAERVEFNPPISVTADDQFDFYAEAVKQNEPTPKESAEAGIRNAMSFTDVAIKSGAISGHNLELIDQANAMMQAVLDNLDKQEFPAEFSYHMANAVNELHACSKLCSGKLQESVFDLSVAVEKLRGDYE